MPRWKPLSFAVLAAALAALWLVPSASATVYCVDDTPGELADNLAVDPSCETAQATIAEAVTTANAHAGADSVLIGPGDFTLPGGPGPGYNEVYYYSAGDPIELRGSGTGATHLTMGSTAGMQVGLWIDGPDGSKVGGFELTIPANSDANGDRGMVLGSGVVAEDVRIGGPEATNATGALLGAGSLSLRHSEIELPTETWPPDTAVLALNGDIGILDSTLSGSTGVQAGGGSVTVERTVVDAKTGVTTDSGAIVVRDSLIDLGSRSGATGVNAANFNVGTAAIQATVDGVTIVGGSGPSSVGVRAQADNGEEAVTATVANTVIQGPLKPLQVLADNGRTASLAVSYSNLNYGLVQVNDDLVAGGETGTASYEETEVTDLEPGFIDAIGGNYRLAAASPLIDRGDPAAPPAEELDLEGNARAVAGTCPAGPGRRDIGAYELAPSCPLEAPGGEEAPAGGGSPDGGAPAGSGETGSASPGGSAGAAADPAIAALAAPPQTAIRGPRRVATAGRWARVRLRLSASGEASGFRCEVDGRARACGASLALRLRPGRHTIRAWALGAAGADPSPARIVVRVVAKRPPRA